MPTLSATKPTTQIDFEFYGLQPILPVRSVAETVHFYQDRLGFDLDFLWNASVGFVGIDAASTAGLGRVSRGHPLTGGPIRIQFSQLEPDQPLPSPGITLMVHIGRDIAGLYATYQAAQADIVMRLVERPWGLIEFILRDPNGHLLRFAQESGEG